MRGQVAPGSAVRLDGRELRVSNDGWFLFGFDRDAPAQAELVVRAPDGRETRRALEVERRTYKVQRVDGLAPRAEGRRSSARDFRLDELGEQRQRFLPAEIAGFRGNGVGNAFLRDVDFGAHRNLLQHDRRLHLAR